MIIFFIGGTLVGAFFGTMATALVAGNDADLKDKRIRELSAANRTLEETTETAKSRADHWQKQYWKLRAEQTKNPEAEA